MKKNLKLSSLEKAYMKGFDAGHKAHIKEYKELERKYKTEYDHHTETQNSLIKILKEKYDKK